MVSNQDQKWLSESRQETSEARKKCRRRRLHGRCYIVTARSGAQIKRHESLLRVGCAPGQHTVGGVTCASRSSVIQQPDSAEAAQISRVGLVLESGTRKNGQHQKCNMSWLTRASFWQQRMGRAHAHPHPLYSCKATKQVMYTDMPALHNFCNDRAIAGRLACRATVRGLAVCITVAQGESVSCKGLQQLGRPHHVYRRWFYIAPRRRNTQGHVIA